jgi:salicylate hydroxylase
MKVLIAGAGIGGLAAALALNRAGFEVEIYERSRLAGEVGAGVQVSPNGARVLHALGLAPALERVAFRPQAVELRLHRSGLTVARNPLGVEIERRYGFPYYHLHRADLHRVLETAVRERCGESAIRLGREVDRFEQGPNGVEFVFADGERAGGDVAVGADGIHSRIRAGLLGSESPQFTGHVAWRGLVPADRLRAAGVRPVVTSWMAPRSHAVTYFVRRGELVNFVGVTEHQAWRSESWTERGDKTDLLRDFARWHPTVRAIVEAIDEPYRWALFVRPPLPRWSEGRVTLLGDACHPMLPYMAQGGVMAIEDGCVLAQCLKSRPGDVAAALRDYQAMRLPRTAKVQAGARAAGARFHLSDPLARLKTYGRMGLEARLAPHKAATANAWLMAYDATRTARPPDSA